MLHYYAKDFFSPIIISPFELNNALYVFAVSDLLQVSYKGMGKRRAAMTVNAHTD